MLKKITVIIAGIVLIATFAIGTTVAYLTSLSGTLENVFTIGKVSISLSETTGGEYQLIPGSTIKKDPKVTVLGGSDDCWLFIEVTKSEHFDDYLIYSLMGGWMPLEGNEGIYYRIVEKTDANLDFYILADNKITVTDTLTEEKMSAITDTLKISFKAYAIQKENIDTALLAWEKIGEEGN